MTKGKSYYKEQIVENSYVDFYSASNTVMMDYPLRLGNPKKGSHAPGTAERADTFILDSGIGHEEIGNEDVIRVANKLEPDCIVAADVFGDPEATTERIAEMVTLLQSEDIDSNLIVPLQYDETTSHSDHYEEISTLLSRMGEDISDHWIAAGGIKEETTHEQLQKVANLRLHVGDEAHIHGFGLGRRYNWIVIMREVPWLLDSVDDSTGTQTAVNGKLVNMDCEQIPYQLPRGKNSTVLKALSQELMEYLYPYLLGPDIAPSDAPTELRDTKGGGGWRKSERCWTVSRG